MELRVDVLERLLSAHKKKSHQHPHVFAQRLLAWQTPQELVNVLLRLISQLMCQLDLHPRHHRRRRHETCFSSSHDLVDHFRRAASCLLFFVSGRRVSTPACSIMPARRAGICFSQLLALSGIALPIKLCSSISRIIALRRRRVRVESSCFSHPRRTECWPSVCSLECGAGESKRGRGEWTSPSLNLDAFGVQASLTFAAVRHQHVSSLVSVCPKRLNRCMRRSTLRDHLVVLISSRNFESRLSVIVVE